ncbi:MAG: glycosyltransferase family 1 protein [Acidimicrobiales bacterium]
MPERVRVAVTLEQCWHRVPGGTARAAIDTTAALLARHPELELVGVSACHRRPPLAPHAPPMPVAQLRLPRRVLYDAWHHLRRPAVTRATGPVELIHATGYAFPPPSAPIVWTLHDLAWRRDPSTFTARGVRFFETALRLAHTDASLVLCSSSTTMGAAAAAGLPADRLRLVPLGVRPIGTTAAEVAAVRAKHGLDGPYVLSVGTAEPRKNLARLMEAFATPTLDDRAIDLVVVGPAGWQDGTAAAAARLGHRLRPLGFVPPAELAALYAGAEVFAYPSLWEGFGLPVLEAMAQGVPVVTSEATAMAEVAGDRGAVLVDPLDPEAIATGLTSVLDDPALADRLRTVGHERVAAHTWERTAELTAAAYAELIPG